MGATGGLSASVLWIEPHQANDPPVVFRVHVVGVAANDLVDSHAGLTIAIHLPIGKDDGESGLRGST